MPSVNLEVIKQPRANTVQVADRIIALLAEMQATAPPGIRLGQISYSQADMIKEAIGNVGHLLRDAVVIVAVVLIVFLGSPRPTFISLLAIPISLVASVIVFHMIGATLNTMTLGGIAMALGELVDDSVVDVENILRRLGENRRSRSAAAGDEGDCTGLAGGPLRHRLCHDHHSAGVHAAVRHARPAGPHVRTRWPLPISFPSSPASWCRSPLRRHWPRTCCRT